MLKTEQALVGWGGVGGLAKNTICARQTHVFCSDIRCHEVHRSAMISVAPATDKQITAATRQYVVAIDSCKRVKDATILLYDNKSSENFTTHK